MKMLLGLALLLALTLAGIAADPAVGRLPNGRHYLKHEVNFALKADVARELSPAGDARRPVDRARLQRLHPSIREIGAGHAAAERWLKGEPLPSRLSSVGPDVPRRARTLKARIHPTQDAADVVEVLRQHPDVEWACLNYVHRVALTPSDARWAEQWGPQRIRADEAWDLPQATTTFRVAIVDTGVDLTHPDLATRIVYEKGFGDNDSGDAKRDQRGGASIDHGTHVAGIAAAIRNTIGIAGVAHAEIMAMGCATWLADDQEYGVSSASDAINDAIDHGADVINCSFGNSELSSDEESALDDAEAAGVVVVAAAGNDSTNVVHSPSAGWNEHSWPIIVSNVESDDTLRPSSNYGSAIDLAAPGTDILSTVTTNNQPADPDGQYDYMTGTSMAAPHVCGSILYVRSMNPDLIGGAAAKHLLYRMALDLGSPGKDDFYGYGLLQLAPEFLRVLRNADAFVTSSWEMVLLPSGSYGRPYLTIEDAVAAVSPGDTLVLNGGLDDVTSYEYPPVTIRKAVTLRALPDRSVIIGR
jgi:subtilisin family serine protease